MHRNIIPNSKTIRVLNAVAAGQTTQTTTKVDHQGFRSVVYEILLGTLTSTNVCVAKVQFGDESGGGDMEDVTGLTYTTVDTQSGKVIRFELYKPTKRYSQVVITRTTANAVLDGVLAHLFHDNMAPETADSSCVGNITKIQ